ncbi:hypothetical protein PRUPE_8G022300 [Prunus persica]|uniref:Uncharacterized protein n=1 Tax=Prunus persica TaxID=3760 RepID=A0A251MRM2_PRUPE|nr:hypothetical protein PRUPE_8G022300 [Prunus persica]
MMFEAFENLFGVNMGMNGWCSSKAKDSPSLSHNFSPSSADGLTNFYRNLIFQRNFKKSIVKMLASMKFLQNVNI